MSLTNVDLYGKEVTMGYVRAVPNEDKGFSFYYTIDAAGKPQKIGKFTEPMDVRVYSAINASWVPILAAAKGWPENKPVSVEGPNGLVPVELPPQGPGEVWAAYSTSDLPKGFALPSSTDQANDTSKTKRRVWLDSGDVNIVQYSGGKDLQALYDTRGLKEIKGDTTAPPKDKDKDKADAGYWALAVLAFVVFFMLTRED